MFGCLSYLKIPKQLITDKFASRTLQCLLIGYCANGYKLWSPEENRVVYGRDIKFDENKFQIVSSDTDFWLPSEVSEEERMDVQKEDQESDDLEFDDAKDDSTSESEEVPEPSLGTIIDAVLG